MEPKIGVGVIVPSFYNDTIRILLEKRANNHGAYKWGPPGGHLEFAETICQCAIREAKEEAGINISSAEWLRSLSTENIIKDDINYCFRHYISHFVLSNDVFNPNSPKVVNPYKTEQLLWIDVNELPKAPLPLFEPLETVVRDEIRFRTLVEKLSKIV